MSVLALLLAAALTATPATVVSERADSVAVTIYRDGPARPPQDDSDGDGDEDDNGFALITETRTIEVPAGQAKISFRGVADRMIPQTASLEGLPGALVERNYDYDLLSPGALIARFVGKPVKLVRTNPRTGKATEVQGVLRSGPNGVVLEIDGKLEALKCSGLPERLVFDGIPPGLTDKPTLSVFTRAARPGRYTVRLSYLASGLNWAADYVAHIRPDGRTLDLTGLITLSNHTTAGFANAPTQVVAGKLSKDDSTHADAVEAQSVSEACWPSGTTHNPPPVENIQDVPLAVSAMAAPAPPGVQELVVTAQKRSEAVLSELGDYKLYTLPEPTTVAAKQTKQVLMLQQDAVPFERLYAYVVNIWGIRADDQDGEGAVEAPNLVLRLENKAAAGLGRPLPAGTVAVIQTDPGGRPILAGQHTIADTPVGLPLDMTLGRAMDLSVKPRLVAQRVLPTRGESRDIELTLTNAKPAPVTLEIMQPIWRASARIKAESQPHTLKAGSPLWSFTLAPGERKVLTYTLQTGSGEE